MTIRTLSSRAVLSLLALCTSAWSQTGWQTSGNNVYVNVGNVGVGTAAPQSALHVNGGVLISPPDGWTLGHTTYLYFGDTLGDMLSDTWGTGITLQTNGGALNFRTAGNTRLYVGNAGNVGIGTANPAAPLHVSSYSYGAPSLAYHSGTTMFSLDVPNNVELAVGWLGGAPYSYWIQSRGGGFAQPLSLNPLGGNVGIGTTAPVQIIHTRVSSGDSVWRMDTATKAAGILKLYDASGDVAIQTNSLANALYVQNLGNVGIGTTNPQQKLSVNGTIGTREVVVTSSGWADYVFRPDYRLQPLREVAAYIRENHRLPDIPTEVEVKENGISVGEMQAKLLAKIEELTLHVIEAEKRADSAERRILQLERSNPGGGM